MEKYKKVVKTSVEQLQEEYDDALLNYLHKKFAIHFLMYMQMSGKLESARDRANADINSFLKLNDVGVYFEGLVNVDSNGNFALDQRITPIGGIVEC